MCPQSGQGARVVPDEMVRTTDWRPTAAPLSRTGPARRTSARILPDGPAGTGPVALTAASQAEERAPYPLNPERPPEGAIAPAQGLPVIRRPGGAGEQLALSPCAWRFMCTESQTFR